VVRIELARDVLDEVGFIVDYGDLKPVKQWIDDTPDRRKPGP
jgi:6-pyruvoyl-tetrahydropterin synthase